MLQACGSAETQALPVNTGNLAWLEATYGHEAGFYSGGKQETFATVLDGLVQGVGRQWGIDRTGRFDLLEAPPAQPVTRTLPTSELLALRSLEARKARRGVEVRFAPNAMPIDMDQLTLAIRTDHSAAGRAARQSLSAPYLTEIYPEDVAQDGRELHVVLSPVTTRQSARAIAQRLYEILGKSNRFYELRLGLQTQDQDTWNLSLTLQDPDDPFLTQGVAGWVVASDEGAEGTKLVVLLPVPDLDTGGFYGGQATELNTGSTRDAVDGDVEATQSPASGSDIRINFADPGLVTQRDLTEARVLGNVIDPQGQGLGVTVKLYETGTQRASVVAR